MSAGDAGRGPRMYLDPRVRGLGASATIAIGERSNALRAAGRDVIKLGLGQSPFPVPAPVVAALRESAHEKDYLPVRGLPRLREAVAAYHARRGDADRTGEDVLIGPGSKELMFLLQLCHGGEMVIPAPAWVSYAPQARLVGRPVVRLAARAADRWLPSADGLAAVCAAGGAGGERPRVLVLNYPSNPVGTSYEDGELAALAEVARAHRVIVLSDEIYGEVHHRGAHVSIARWYPEGTIISSGLSKWCGAGGWRLGTFSFPPELRWLLDAMAAAASETFTATSAPIQHAAVSAFEGASRAVGESAVGRTVGVAAGAAGEGGRSLAGYLAGSRRVLAAIGGVVCERLRRAGADCPEPAGGFYLFPSFEPVRERLAARGIETAPALCEALLADCDVAALPGSEFGLAPDALTIRIAYVDFDGAAALGAVGELDGAVAAEARAARETFAARHAARVVTAADRIADWLAAAQLAVSPPR